MWPSSSNAALPPIFVFKPLIPHLPILYLLPLPLHLRLLLLAVLLRSILPLPLLTPSGFFNGMLEVFEPGALNCYTFFRNIPLIYSVSRNPIFTHIPFSGFLHSLLCVPIAPTPVWHSLSPDATHASGSVIIFIRQGLSFSELSTSFLSIRSIPTLLCRGQHL